MEMSPTCRRRVCVVRRVTTFGADYSDTADTILWHFCRRHKCAHCYSTTDVANRVAHTVAVCTVPQHTPYQVLYILQHFQQHVAPHSQQQHTVTTTTSCRRQRRRQVSLITAKQGVTARSFLPSNTSGKTSTWSSLSTGARFRAAGVVTSIHQSMRNAQKHTYSAY